MTHSCLHASALRIQLAWLFAAAAATVWVARGRTERFALYDSVGCCAAKEAESQSVAVLYEHRAAPQELKRGKVIDAVIEHVPRPPHTVKLKGASKTISVQVRCC